MRMSVEEYKAHVAKHAPKEKKAKFGNRVKIVDGITFQSTKEANRYVDLKIWQQTGQITELTHQRVFEINIGDEHICVYQSDFTYLRDGKLIVEDTKSKITRKLPVYRIKKKLMKAVLAIVIQEV